jgi:hypothetical protein
MRISNPFARRRQLEEKLATAEADLEAQRSHNRDLAKEVVALEERVERFRKRYDFFWMLAHAGNKPGTPTEERPGGSNTYDAYAARIGLLSQITGPGTGATVAQMTIEPTRH